MTYRFRPGEPSHQALARIARAELSSAIGLLANSKEPLEYRVHEVRKHGKRLRALFALAEGGVSARKLDRVRRKTRKAARALADLRGSAALRECFEALHRAEPTQLDPALVRRVRELLSAGEDPRETLARDLSRAERLLRRARRRLGRLRFDSNGWDAVSTGFRRTYREARKALKRALECPEPELLHRLRIPAKRHRYHVQLFEELWPEQVSRCKDLAELGALLGDHHDLSLLLSHLEGLRLPAKDLCKLEDCIARRSRCLERQVFGLGKCLFDEKPRELVRRLDEHFEGLENRSV